MYTHSDPTASRAIGCVNNEWKRMLRLAYRFRTTPQPDQQFFEPEKVFTGIFRRLLTDPLEDLERALFQKK